MKTFTEEDVRQTLGILGSSSAEIAASLANKGAQGRVSDANSCVISVYLDTQFPASEPMVTQTLIQLVSPTRKLVTLLGQCPGVPEFIEDFDNGAYPELIQHRDGCTEEFYVFNIPGSTQRACYRCQCGNLVKKEIK